MRQTADKYETMTQRWLDAGPSSTTMARIKPTPGQLI